MDSFESFLQDLSLSTGIKFNLKFEDYTHMHLGIGNTSGPNIEIIYTTIGSSKVKLEVFKEYKSCIPLLKYTIENKHKEIFSRKEKLFVDILQGQDIAVEIIEESYPFISKGCTLFIVNVDGNRYEALNIIRQLYIKEEVISFLYNNTIIVMGVFDEVIEHAKSIKESIVSDLYCKCYVSYGSIIYDVKEIRKAYEEAKECLIISKKFGIKEEILNYSKMLFEKIVYNINSNVKNELLSKLENKFNMFDSELINTIEEFIKCDLNISDAARKLYIHRNTLIYRLDKITKETEFDIRNFKEATVFIIAFLIWKESKI